jgi:hypothetical protein
MARVSSKVYPGGHVSRIRGALTTSCPDCGAEAGAPCRKFKIEGGQRMYVVGTLKRPHDQRKSAAIARRTG